MIWRCTTNEQFSVKSAYHLEIERQTKEDRSISQTRHFQFLEDNMEVQGSQRWQDVFMESLQQPSPHKKANMFRRKAVRDPNCPIVLESPNQ
jgi:hypothetical protein